MYVVMSIFVFGAVPLEEDDLNDDVEMAKGFASGPKKEREGGH